MKIEMKRLLLLSLIAGGLFSCKTESEGEQKMLVAVAEAKIETHETQKEFPFIAKPFRSSELSFRVGGPINRLEVYPGNYYKHGHIIAEIDSRDFRIRKERAEAIYHQAKAEYERIQALYEKENVSASTYEKAKSEYTSAKVAFETAVNELNDTRLLAPFNGYVSEVYVEKYQDVKATQPVLSLIDIDQLKVEVYVTQDIALHAQNLNTVNLTFDALPDKRYDANVVEVSKGVMRNNLSYMLTALLPNEDKSLLAGMSGKVFFDVTTGEGQPKLSVPQSALCHRPTVGDYVWTVDKENNKVNLRKVVMGELLINGRVSIVSGLEEGEIVAVTGLRFLSDGMSVGIK